MIGNFIGYPIGARPRLSTGTVTYYAIGTAAGSSTVNGSFKAFKPGVGLSAGISTAQGVSRTNIGVGVAAGTSSALGALTVKSASKGTATGHATVAAVSGVKIFLSSTGIARGTSTARSKGRASGDPYITTPRVLERQITA